LNHCERPSVAVVGAGIAGLVAARALFDHGLPVTLFEKSRGVGGRMATRRTEQGLTFDHGAQYFTVRDARFRRCVESWEQQGIVAKWPEAGSPIVTLRSGQVISCSESTQRFVGTPAMTAIPKHLASTLSIQLETLVAGMQSTDSGSIELFDKTRQPLGRFQRVVVALPSTQAAVLLENWPEVQRIVAGVAMEPCWALLAGFSQTLPVTWSGAFLEDSFLSWACRNGSKPDRRAGAETLVLHASAEWSRENLETDTSHVAELMLQEFWRVSGLRPAPADSVQTHRWRFAIPPVPLTLGAIESDDRRIVVCGDWCHGARIEGAFLSGNAAAGRILNRCARLESTGSHQRTLF
jgi:hypothetical protein